MSLPRLRIRLALDAGKIAVPPLDALTGSTPILWRGNDVQFELGIFYNDVLQNISNLDSVRLDVKPAADRTAAALMTKVIAAAQLNNTLTAAQWTNGTAQHATVDFANTETNLSLSGGPDANTKDFWLVVMATTTDVPAREITLGGGTLRVIEDGTGSALLTPTPGPPTAYTKEEADARFGSNVIKTVNAPGVSILLKNAAGYGILLYVGTDNELHTDTVNP